MDKAGGGSVVVDTEQKATENLGQCIVGYDVWPRIKFASPSSYEEGLRIITGMFNILTDAAKKNGKRMPVLIGLDSTEGITSEGESDKIKKAGTATRSFPESAMLGAKYLKDVPSKISSMPIILVGVRHERMVDTGYGTKQAEPKGAGAWSFHTHTSFHLQKAPKEKIDCATHGGRKILICLKKSTDTGIQVPATMLWRDEITAEGEGRRYIWFDWAGSAFNLFTAPATYKIPLRMAKMMKDVLGPMSASGGRVICKPLGLTTPATPQELHEALYHQDNKQTLDLLRAAFCLRVGQEFRYGDDFDELKERQRAIVLARTGSRNDSDCDLEHEHTLDEDTDTES